MNDQLLTVCTKLLTQNNDYHVWIHQNNEYDTCTSKTVYTQSWRFTNRLEFSTCTPVLLLCSFCYYTT